MKSGTAVAVFGVTALVGVGFVIMARAFSGYAVGDVLDMFIAGEGGWGNYVTVLDKTGDSYQLIEGWWPNTIGIPYWLSKTDIKTLPVQKVGHVTL